MGETQSAALGDSKFPRRGGAVDRFLYLLSVAHSDRPGEFERVLGGVKGRGRRVHFARSAKEIEASGRSTDPKNIPGSKFWVLTNSPTEQKREMLAHALEVLGYSAAAIDDAVRAVK